MDGILKKLNYKDQKEIVLINSPSTFEIHIQTLESVKVIRNITEAQEITFIISFVQKQTEIEALVPLIAPKLKGDATVWFCYPKGSSKRYQCDFNRDSGWAIVGSYDLEGVRMVAIDEDWSALRFRKISYIKTMTRKESFALSKGGKEKTTNKGESN